MTGWTGSKKFFGVLLASIGLLRYALIGVAPKSSPWILPAALMLGGLAGFMEERELARRLQRRSSAWAARSR